MLGGLEKKVGNLLLLSRLHPQISSPQDTKVKRTLGRSLFLGKDLSSHKLWVFWKCFRQIPLFSGFRLERKLSAQRPELATGEKKNGPELTTYSSS